MSGTASITGFIYFIQAKTTNFVKIGMTTDSPSARLSSLATGCPHQLVLYGSFPVTDPGWTEKQIHADLARYAHRGEWFEIEPDSLNELFTHFRIALSDEEWCKADPPPPRPVLN